MKIKCIYIISNLKISKYKLINHNDSDNNHIYAINDISKIYLFTIYKHKTIAIDIYKKRKYPILTDFRCDFHFLNHDNMTIRLFIPLH